MEQLKSYAEELNISIDETSLSAFSTYYEMLVETNKVMNLTAITEKDEVILKHYIDSILPLSEKKIADIFSSSKTMIDIGTGAGFPGIPLKLAAPNLSVTLLDSLNKRVGFLNSVIKELGLKEISAIHARAEEGARNASYRDHFDIAVSRAVAALPVLAEYCLPFVRVGGYFISYKSGEIEEEVNSAKKAIATLGGKIEAVIPAGLPDSDIARSFVLIKKVKPTPKQFPRKPGTAKKTPL